MHEVVVLDKKQGFPRCQVVVPCIAIIPNIGPNRSAMLPEVVNIGQSYVFTRPDEDTWNKNHKKSATICKVTTDVETSRLGSYTRPHYKITTPLVLKA